MRGIDIDVVIDFLGYTPDDMQTDVEVFGGVAAQLIFISSCTVYRKPHTDLPITEQHPVGNPFSEYAQKKQASEEFLLSQSSIPVTVVRPSHTFSRKWVPNCVRSAGYTFVDRLERGLPVFVPNDGSNPWTLTSTRDFAKGLCGLVGNERAFGEIFHITSDEHPTWKEIYAFAAQAAGTPPPDIAEVPVDFICKHFPSLIQGIKGDKCEPAIFDNSKIKSFVPSFECTDTVPQAIKASIDWLRAHPEDKNISEKVSNTFQEVVDAWRKT
jgi:nucleoside-diphosphate-sugar epimerase